MLLMGVDEHGVKRLVVIEDGMRESIEIFKALVWSGKGRSRRQLRIYARRPDEIIGGATIPAKQGRDGCVRVKNVKMPF